MYKEPPYLILILGSWIHHFGFWFLESPDIGVQASYMFEGTSKCVANSIEGKINASAARGIPFQSNIE